MKQHSATIFKIEKVTLSQKLNSEFQFQLALEITMSYRGNTQKVITFFLPYQEKVFETANSNPEHIIEIFDNTFAKGINGYNIEQFNSYDKYLAALLFN